VLKSPAFAETLRAIARGGADAFYDGPIAQDILATVTGHPTNAGDMTAADLKSYRVVERAPVCGPYRVYKVCGMGPPSSGAVAVQQILSTLETRDLARMGPGPEAAHWISGGARLAYATAGSFSATPPL
jgi:gamma-glutamyltranspeptidase/glutathione hydrolase